jgi:hypothetical protein
MDYLWVWEQLSSRFAEKLSGVANVVLNGASDFKRNRSAPPYKADSIFTRIELPKIVENTQVTKLNVILIHPPENNVQETCADRKSLDDLDDKIKTLVSAYNKKKKANRKLPWECVDDNLQYVSLLCFLDSKNQPCQDLVKNNYS